MDFQQPHGYMNTPAPPPPMSMPEDPYHHQSQRLPVPPPNPWYSTQFQYQHTSSPPPPLPLPPHALPQHQQWAPAPPHSDLYTPPPPYPASSPYTAHHPAPHNQYPPPPLPHQFPPLPPRPHIPPPQIPQSYPQVNQDWGNANWSHHQSWDYQANTNEEVWAAKARAWAAAKLASDGHQTQHLPYAAVNDGSLAGDSTAVYPWQDSSISPSVHQQEVPSSYSSITGDHGIGIDPVAPMPSDYVFAPPAEPPLVYPSVPAVLPSGPQVDPSAAVPSPIPAHSAPIFGRIPGPSFQKTGPSVAAPFGICAGTELHPITTFSGDSFGVSGISERPKKASVPNWLREEIIKKKPVIVSAAQESLKDDVQSTEDEGGDKSYGKGDQADSKSFASSRSTEDEDDDEDEVEAARTAALNQEIKRVLTEVLLKVTDELFDEIATKVLNEDDTTPEDNKASTSTRPIPTSKPAAKVLVPVKTQETNSYSASENSASSPAGNVLGLASYASEDDEDSEIQSSERLILKENTVQRQSPSSKFSEGMDVVGNSDSRKETKENLDNHAAMESGPSSSALYTVIVSGSALVTELGKERALTVSAHQGFHFSSKVESGVAKNMLQDGFNDPKGTLDSKAVLRTGKQVENTVPRKSAVDDSVGQETRYTSDKNDIRKNERTSAGKDQKTKELDIGKLRGNESHRRHDERHMEKERRIDQNGSKDRVKEKVVKSAEKAQDSNSRKRPSPNYVKEGRKERQTDRRSSGKEDSGRKRERTRDDKREKPRHTNASESGRQKRHRSSSVSNRSRDNKDGSIVSGASYSSDESSDNSKRKLHSKRQKSPSTVRSRKRQVLRSPHSKHSQRRHSPYSSIETTRGRRSRSRSRSPVRWKR